MFTPDADALVKAALEHMEIQGCAAAVIKVPGTEPPLYVAVGPAATLLEILGYRHDADSAEIQPGQLGG